MTMLDKLDETDRMGVVALCNDLTDAGCLPSQVDHVRELVIARTLSCYFFAGECRKKEATIDDLRAELAAAREALSNANERALAYDDELRTLRHRAERMGRVVEAAIRERETHEAADREIDKPVLEWGNHTIAKTRAAWREAWTAYIDTVNSYRTLDDASAGES